MGKGGTKFCGDAIGVRSGRKASTYTGKELRKQMDKYLATGVHPDLERARTEAAAAGPAAPLPDVDINRPFVFLDLTLDGKACGRLVVELFEDLVPVAASHLRNRCLPGATGSLSGAAVHKLLPNFALHMAKSSAVASPQHFPLHTRLRHTEPGAVSVSRDGTEVVIALTRAPALDASHQVVGRISAGMDALEPLSDLPTTPDDAPINRLRIARCGPTNHKGTHDALDESLGKETAAQTAARLAKESQDTRSAVLEALQAGGLGVKRKADAAAAGEAGPSSRGAAASAAPARAGGDGKAGGAAGGAVARSVRAKMLDAMLDDLEGSSEDDSSGEASGG